MPVVYGMPNYGQGGSTGALDALRRLVPGNTSPAGGLRPNPFGQVDTTTYGAPSTELWGPQTAVDNSTRPGFGADLSPQPQVPPRATPPVEQAADVGVLESLRQAFPPRQFEGPRRLQLEQ